MARRTHARETHQRVVQCHGCFDIVHPGHLRHLRHAKAQGDILLVTITGDSMIEKGTGRPLIPQELRAENLAALDCVDWVYIEPRPTAVELLDEVRPDVYVKGREYENNADPRFKAEQAAVLRHGGRIVFSSGDVVFSSSALIAALEQSADPYHARLRGLFDAPDLGGETLSRLIGSFRGKRVVVVGEVILDTYVLCDRPDVAGESPIMTLRPVERRCYDGGAAVIARHLAAMGATPTLVTALDDSDESDALKRRLAAEGIQVRAVRAGRPIPEKQRFLVGAQKVMKLDLVERIEPDATMQEELLRLVSDVLTETSGGGGGVDAAIIADFGLGLMSQSVLRRLCPLVRRSARIVTGDVSSKRSHLPYMTDMDLLCPSEQELREAYRQFDDSLPAVAYHLLAATRARHAIVTLGPEGLVAFDRLSGFDATAGEWGTKVSQEHVPALSGAAVDPLGCGDALLAAATLALASGGGLLTASFLGAAAAAVQVQRLGNTVISASDLRGAVARLHAAHLAYAPAEVGGARPQGAGHRPQGAQIGTIAALSRRHARRTGDRVVIAYVLPTRNRPLCLARALAALGALPAHDAEVIVVDNASDPPAKAPVVLPNGLHVTLVMRARNEGAAGRNAGVRAADPSCEWVVMLDDDSHPVDLRFLTALREQPDDVAAVAGEIFLHLPQADPANTVPCRESGGLPEVFIGCGVAIRRNAFLRAKIRDTAGYDPTFGFYAEEYDLSARFIREGMRTVFDRRFAVLHEKTPAGRSMDTILRRLVRNNAWVMQRYAPRRVRSAEIRRTLRRYGSIALKERSELGYAAGLAELAWTLPRQPRLELDARSWDRFTGKAACRRSMLEAWSRQRFASATIIAPGKNDHIVRECLEELGVEILPHAHAHTDHAEALVIGTLSPGPALDAHAAHASDPRVIDPWPGAAPAAPPTAISAAA